MFAKLAAGDIKQADDLMVSYSSQFLKNKKEEDVFLKNLKLENVSTRVNEWKDYHDIAANSIFGGSVTTQDLIPGIDNSDSSDDGTDDDSYDTDDTTDSDDTVSDSQNIQSTSVSAKHKTKIKLPNMAHVDVVILSTEEVRSQAKGINLLAGLKATLTGTLFTYDKTRVSTNTNDSTVTSKIIAPSFTLMDLEYNLNIFNDEMNKAEVLARPSLLATEGSSSKFFSGGELHVQLSSNNADGSMIDVPIGIHLSVKPKFFSDDHVQITVHAERAFLEQKSIHVGFTSVTQTVKTDVSATAVLKFGETLMLSGLSETTSDKSNSGVPFIKKIPFVQYLFSRDEALETKKSILIFLTPRKARYAESLTVDELDNKMDLEKVYTNNLKKRERIANTNLNVAIAHLSDESDFYRQFRAGDIGVSFWESDDSLFGALKRSLGFLYY